MIIYWKIYYIKEEIEEEGWRKLLILLSFKIDIKITTLQYLEMYKLIIKNPTILYNKVNILHVVQWIENTK